MELLNNKRLQQFEQLRAQELSIMIRSIWEERNRESVVVAAVDLNVKMCYLTMNIMTQMMMSKRFFTYGGEEALMERTAGLSQAAAEVKCSSTSAPLPVQCFKLWTVQLMT